MHNKEAKLLPSDTFLSRKKCVCGRGSAPDSAGGAYSSPADPLAGNGEGPLSERGRERERKGGKRRGGEGKVGEE